MRLVEEALKPGRPGSTGEQACALTTGLRPNGEKRERSDIV